MEIEKNIERQKMKAMSGGVDERDKIMASAINNQEGATISCVV